MPPSENLTWIGLTRDVSDKWFAVAEQLSLSDSEIAELLIASYRNSTETSPTCRCCGSALPSLCSACLRQQHENCGAENIAVAQSEARCGELNPHAAQPPPGHQHLQRWHRPDAANDDAEVQIKIESVSSLRNVSQEQSVKLEYSYGEDEEADSGSIQLQEMEGKNKVPFLPNNDSFNEEDYENADADNNLEHTELDSDQIDLQLGVTFMNQNKRRKQLCSKQDHLLTSKSLHPKETGSLPNKRDKLHNHQNLLQGDAKQNEFDPKTVCVVLKRCDSILANSEQNYCSITDSKRYKQITQNTANKIPSDTTAKVSSAQKSPVSLARCLPSATKQNKLLENKIAPDSSTGTEPMMTVGTNENMVYSKTGSDVLSAVNSNVREESVSVKLNSKDRNGLPMGSGCYPFEKGSGMPGCADAAQKNTLIHSCSICNKAFRKPSRLQRHLFQVHKAEGRKCDLCKKVVISSHLKEHREKFHGLVDDAADKYCTSANIIGTSLCLNESDLGKRDAEGNAAIDYDNVIHDEQSITSTDDVDENRSEEHTILKKQLQHQEKKHVCEVCDKKFRYPCEYSLHKKRAHMGKPYRCSKCDKSFSLPHYLLDHENIHSGRKPYTCPDCETNFHTKMELLVHKSVHRKRDSGPSGKNDFVLKTMMMKLNCCSICDKAFRKPSKLQRHLFQVHKMEGSKCTLCKKVVISSQLREHQKIFHGFADDAAEKYCTSNKSETKCYSNKSNHEGRILVSDRGGKNLDKIETLKLHKCLHGLELGQFICKKCNNNFQTKVQPEDHSLACKSSEISFADTNLLEERLCEERITSLLVDEHTKCFYKTGEYASKTITVETFCNPSVNLRDGEEEKQNRMASTKDNNSKCSLCGEAFTCLLLLKQHNEHAHLLGMTTLDENCMCGVCLQMDKNQEQVIDRDASDGIRYECNICEENLTSLETLKEHKCDKHRAEILTETLKKHRCKFCNLQFSCLFDYKMHVSLKHWATAYRCAHCSKIFLSARSLKDHENVHTGSKPYKCANCDEDFHKHYTLMRHKSQKHKDILQDCAKNSTKSPGEMGRSCSLHARCFQCQLCNKCYGAQTQLKIHISACHEVKKFSCEFCGKLFGRIEGLRKHRSVHSDSRPFACETCHKSFKTKYLLRSHALTHTATRRLVCEFCGLSTNSSGDLKKHIRIHTDEKPYACNECPQRFCRKSKLNEHKKRKHSTRVKSIFCTLCSSSFYSNYGLKSHMERIHATATRQYSCPDCQKPFFTKAELNSHMNTHLYKKERVIPKKSKRKNPDIYCEQCLKTFSSRSNLLAHMSVHSAVKHFKCSMCPKAFKQYCSLSKHIISHSGNPKPYVCDICQKGFPQKGMLKFHKLKHAMSSSSFS